MLASVVPRLRFEEAERPAQLRVRVEDISGGRFAAMANERRLLRIVSSLDDAARGEKPGT